MGVGLQGFEHRLERLVEGGFARAFRSGLQPVEIARRICRELDAEQVVTPHGNVAPNHIAIYMSTVDHERFATFAASLSAELAEIARDHARAEEYLFLGPLRIDLAPDTDLKKGDFDVASAVRETKGGRFGSLLTSTGVRIAMTDHATIGRLPESSIPLNDPKVSRHHADIRYDTDGYVLTDNNSTNGTRVNGTPIQRHRLQPGDVIEIGSVELRFEAS